MIEKKLSKNAKKIDQFLIKFIKRQKKSLLVKPMKYGVLSGGKKIRSTIILDAGKIYNISEKNFKNRPKSTARLRLVPHKIDHIFHDFSNLANVGICG